MSKINQSRIDKILSRHEVSLVGKPSESGEIWEATSQSDVICCEKAPLNNIKYIINDAFNLNIFFIKKR